MMTYHNRVSKKKTDQDGLITLCILYVNICLPAELTLNIWSAKELVLQLTRWWDKIFKIKFLLHSGHV